MCDATYRYIEYIYSKNVLWEEFYILLLIIIILCILSKITTSISLTLLYNETHYYCSEADRLVLVPYIYKRTHLSGSKKNTYI